MNPHHHLHESTLMSYAAGALPAPLSIVAGAHLEQCPHCRQRLRDAE
ncbi:transcriptional regulator, partial [Stenotrophomonas maltophilia]